MLIGWIKMGQLNMKEEKELFEKFKKKFIEEYGYDKKNIKIKPRIKRGRSRAVIPDIVVYQEDKPYIVIELKDSLDQKKLQRVKETIYKTARFLKAPYFMIWTSGFTEVYKIEADSYKKIDDIPSLKKKDEPKNLIICSKRYSDDIELGRSVFSLDSSIGENLSESIDSVIFEEPEINFQDAISGIDEDLFTLEYETDMGIEETPQKNEPVKFSVYVKENIKRSESFILDVWAYKVSQFSIVQEKIKQYNRDIQLAEKTVKPIKESTMLNIYLSIEDIDYEQEDFIYWMGEPENATFKIKLPDDYQKNSAVGTVQVKCEGMTIVKLDFEILIDQSEIVNFGTNYIKTAFASYASNDRAEVLKRIQGINKALPDLDIYVDSIKLRSGENWLNELEKHIPNKDVFYLFWSKDAAKSKWVEKEWKMALDKKDISYIDPVPLDDPMDTPPPNELSALHFNDAYLAYIKYEESRTTK